MYSIVIYWSILSLPHVNIQIVNCIQSVNCRSRHRGGICYLKAVDRRWEGGYVMSEAAGRVVTSYRRDEFWLSSMPGRGAATDRTWTRLILIWNMTGCNVKCTSVQNFLPLREVFLDGGSRRLVIGFCFISVQFSFYWIKIMVLFHFLFLNYFSL